MQKIKKLIPKGWKTKIRTYRKRKSSGFPAGKKYPSAIAPYIQKIQESDGSRYYRRAPVRIGIIADTFLYEALSAAAYFIRILPDQYQKQIKDMDVLLVASAWSGENEEWRGISTEGKPKREAAYAVIDLCKQKGIPTIFYSKEDPTHYDRYLGLAKRCDCVLTSCVEKVPEYVEDCGHSRVYPMRFAINPTYHNPIDSRRFAKQPRVIFAGSWMEKYPERSKDLRMLLSGVLQSGRWMHIIDRMYASKEEKHRFPRRFQPFLCPSMQHADLQKAHKLYNWAININTIKNSNTMFANRVYELQACGNVMLSNYSIGVNARAPAVFTVLDSEEAARILHAYSGEALYLHQMTALRFVMTGDTCFDRMTEMLDHVGIEAEQPTRSIAVFAKDPQTVQEAFDRQTYPHKALFPMEELTDERLLQYDMVAFFHPDMFYGEFYLEDMINGFKYTDSDYITKDRYRNGKNLSEGHEHAFVSLVRSKYRTIFWSQAFKAEFLRTMRRDRMIANGYSIDHFNYNAAGDIQKEEGRENPYALSVIIPVYNNGKALFGKAFASLYRSSLFKHMEILLVDDGSTDRETRAMVSHLAREYPNVFAYFFPEGGSGSASRPRNKGAELATADYITYLDPDNEAINDGFEKLYRIAQKGEYDLVIGNLMVCKETPIRSYYYTRIQTAYQRDEIENNGADFLRRIEFMPMSNQATVLKRSIIADNQLEHVVGALGQDSLFSYQVMRHSKRIKAVETPVVVYYAAIEGTSVNKITRNFFQKYYLVHEAQAKWLRKEGILEDYVRTRFTYYFQNWMLKKMILFEGSPEERKEVSKICWAMFSLYADAYHGEEPVIAAFRERCVEGDYVDAFSAVEEAFAREEDKKDG